MRRFTSISVALLAGATFALAGTAHAQGDAARGDTLFHVTYGCNECHGDNPGPGFAPTLTGPTLLNIINFVTPMKNRFKSTLDQNPTDLADIAAWVSSLGGGVQAGLDINQHGLTGSWYEAATSGQGVEMEFFPDLVAPGTALVQGAWFTFDIGPRGGADRERWYTFSGNAVRGQTSVPITIYRNVGGNFNAAPVTSATAVGSGTLAFTDCDNGTLAYQFSDGSGRMKVTCLITTCRGRLTLVTTKGKRLGSATFRLKARQTRTVRIKLKRPLRRGRVVATATSTRPAGLRTRRTVTPR